jgi:hypothetical protein
VGSYPDGAPRAPANRRRGRSSTLAVLAAVLVGVWWVRTPDPRADLRALADPTTYADLLARAEELVDGVATGGERLLAGGSGGVPVVEVARPDDAPPPGLGEAGSRLAPPVGPGASDPSYAFAALQDDGDAPVAWSPCRAVHYVVRTQGAPAGFVEAVRGAVGEVSAATGLVFADDGATDEAPDPGRQAYLPDRYGDRWAPVLVAVTDATAVPTLDGDVAGVTYTYRARGPSSGVWHLTSGAVYLDAEALDGPGGPGGEPAWAAVLRHELGHLVGLDHVDDPRQLMNPVTSDVRTFQGGDRTGLAILGRGECAPDL